MKRVRGNYFASLSVGVFLAFSILGGGADSRAASPEYIGAERCGTCHRAEYEEWKNSQHARALERLTPQERRQQVCRGCHTMVPGKEDPALQGVQCESCHGAGSLYAPRHVMRDPVLAELLGLEPVTVATCRPCHAEDSPRVNQRNLEELLKEVAHGSKARTEAGPGASDQLKHRRAAVSRAQKGNSP